MNYNIQSVVDRMGLKLYRKGSDNSAYYICPLCGSKKLNINYEKNVWRCNKCQEGGGMIKFVQDMLNISNDDAKKWLKDNSDSINVNYKTLSLKKEEFIQPEIYLDKIYRRFIELLELKQKHIDDLKKRGLTDKEIQYYKFRSLPEDKSTAIPQRLINEGFDLRGVPGFYYSRGAWRINAFPTGYLIPFKNINGKITGFQIRNDRQTEKYGKYMSFTSTGKKEGTQSKVPVHLIGYNGQDTIYLTEGALKADVARYLSRVKYNRKIAFLAIPGVNNTSSLKKALPILKKRGVTRIVDAFDMDKIGNISCEKNSHVENAVKTIRKMVEVEGIEWKHLYWKKGKGIDDFLLLSIKKKKREK